MPDKLLRTGYLLTPRASYGVFLPRLCESARFRLCGYSESYPHPLPLSLIRPLRGQGEGRRTLPCILNKTSVRSEQAEKSHHATSLQQSRRERTTWCLSPLSLLRSRF